MNALHSASCHNRRQAEKKLTSTLAAASASFLPLAKNFTLRSNASCRMKSGASRWFAESRTNTASRQAEKPHICTHVSAAPPANLAIKKLCLLHLGHCTCGSTLRSRAVRALAPHHQSTPQPNSSDPNGGMIVEQGAFCRGKCEGVDLRPRPSRCPMTRRENAQRGPAAPPLLQSIPTGVTFLLPPTLPAIQRRRKAPVHAAWRGNL